MISLNVYYYHDEIIDGTWGNYVNDYTDKASVSSDVLPFWENILYHKGWANTSRLKKLRASVLLNITPIKQLTE